MSSIICSEIVNINGFGITAKSGKKDVKICFDECAKNYANENSLDKSRCVATRNISKLTFTFYTNPKTKVVFKKHFLKILFSGRSAVSKFFELQKAINKYGYTSYDLS